MLRLALQLGIRERLIRERLPRERKRTHKMGEENYEPGKQKEMAGPEHLAVE